MGREVDRHLLVGPLVMTHAGPFFAVEGRDVTAFPTRQAAEVYLEAQDVEDDVYAFFAADGTQLRLTTEGGRVVVTDEPLGSSPERLARVLRHHLLAVPRARRRLDDDAVTGASLEELADESFWATEQR